MDFFHEKYLQYSDLTMIQQIIFHSVRKIGLYNLIQENIT